MKSIFDVFIEVIFDAFSWLPATTTSSFPTSTTQRVPGFNSLPRCWANANSISKEKEESPTVCGAVASSTYFGSHHWTDCYTLAPSSLVIVCQRAKKDVFETGENGHKRWRRYDEVLFSLYRFGSSHGSFTVTSVANTKSGSLGDPVRP